MKLGTQLGLAHSEGCRVKYAEFKTFKSAETFGALLEERKNCKLCKVKYELQVR